MSKKESINELIKSSVKAAIKSDSRHLFVNPELTTVTTNPNKIEITFFDSPNCYPYTWCFFGWAYYLEDKNSNFEPNYLEDFENRNDLFSKDKIDIESMKDKMFRSAEDIISWFSEAKRASNYIYYFRNKGYGQLEIDSITVNVPFKKFGCKYSLTIKVKEIQNLDYKNLLLVKEKLFLKESLYSV